MIIIQFSSISNSHLRFIWFQYVFFCILLYIGGLLGYIYKYPKKLQFVAYGQFVLVGFCYRVVTQFYVNDFNVFFLHFTIKIFLYIYIYIYRRANVIYIYIYVYPKKVQFAAYGQFVLDCFCCGVVTQCDVNNFNVFFCILL